MKRLDRQFLIWAVLALFVITWTCVVVPCCADGGDPVPNPGDPADIPPTCQSVDSSAGTFESTVQTLEPTSGILGDFWMILMAMAFQLAL